MTSLMSYFEITVTCQASDFVHRQKRVRDDDLPKNVQNSACPFPFFIYEILSAKETNQYNLC